MQQGVGFDKRIAGDVADDISMKHPANIGHWYWHLSPRLKGTGARTAHSGTSSPRRSRSKTIS